ncbi:hypothetical protein [Micromonospora sp. ATA51]|uniref:hypothetical protein n=1 Tax=Micromonospora sp. ATA51 TaxID=2806098 RepID=UPI001A514AF7|nr:hypothetical protein [Micromonospora sp. ATA51]MBM0224234.1 hypothetical protein [Micromonospora sp. ATA51]
MAPITPALRAISRASIRVPASSPVSRASTASSNCWVTKPGTRLARLLSSVARAHRAYAASQSPLSRS